MFQVFQRPRLALMPLGAGVAHHLAQFLGLVKSIVTMTRSQKVIEEQAFQASFVICHPQKIKDNV